MSDEFMSMTEIGRSFGVSSHKVGKWLVDLSLRTTDKKPSQKAFNEGFVQRRESTNFATYFYVWHAENTMQALDTAGHKRVEAQQA